MGSLQCKMLYCGPNKCKSFVTMVGFNFVTNGKAMHYLEAHIKSDFWCIAVIFNKELF